MGISLTVLGSSAVFPRSDNPCSGFLLQTRNVSVWADCGSGTFGALQQHVDPYRLSALWISHMHPDHCSDLLAAFNWTINMPNAPRLPVYGPPGWAGRLAAMIPSEKATELVETAFEIHELHDQHTTLVGDVRLYSLLVEHSVPAFGLRVEHAGRVIAYSGDTGPCMALVKLAADADTFVCEAGATEPQRAHCTPDEAGQAAAKAGSRRLLLTHIAPGNHEDRAVEAAARVAACPVDHASPGLKLGL